MVKINHPGAAEKYNVVNSPSLVYYRKKVPLLYDGKCLCIAESVMHLIAHNKQYLL
jgi:hypothetical protein